MIPALQADVYKRQVKGREFSVGVIEGKALPIIEIAPVQGFYDYKNKYKAGSAVETCPAELSEAVTEKMQHYAEQVAQVLGLDTYSRTDFLLDENENIYCLEANTLPGMTCLLYTSGFFYFFEFRFKIMWRYLAGRRDCSTFDQFFIKFFMGNGNTV